MLLKQQNLCLQLFAVLKFKKKNLLGINESFIISAYGKPFVIQYQLVKYGYSMRKESNFLVLLLIMLSSL